MSTLPIMPVDSFESMLFSQALIVSCIWKWVGVILVSANSNALCIMATGHKTFIKRLLNVLCPLGSEITQKGANLPIVPFNYVKIPDICCV